MTVVSKWEAEATKSKVKQRAMLFIAILPLRKAVNFKKSQASI